MLIAVAASHASPRCSRRRQRVRLLETPEPSTARRSGTRLPVAQLPRARARSARRRGRHCATIPTRRHTTARPNATRDAMNEPMWVLNDIRRRATDDDGTSDLKETLTQALPPLCRAPLCCELRALPADCSIACVRRLKIFTLNRPILLRSSCRMRMTTSTRRACLRTSNFT